MKQIAQVGLNSKSSKHIKNKCKKVCSETNDKNNQILNQSCCESKFNHRLLSFYFIILLVRLFVELVYEMIFDLKLNEYYVIENKSGECKLDHNNKDEDKFMFSLICKLDKFNVMRINFYSSSFSTKSHQNFEI